MEWETGDGIIQNTAALSLSTLITRSPIPVCSLHSKRSASCLHVLELFPPSTYFIHMELDPTKSSLADKEEGWFHPLPRCSPLSQAPIHLPGLHVP